MEKCQLYRFLLVCITDKSCIIAQASCKSWVRFFTIPIAKTRWKERSVTYGSRVDNAVLSSQPQVHELRPMPFFIQRYAGSKMGKN